jgi:hypothetical protein
LKKKSEAGRSKSEVLKKQEPIPKKFGNQKFEAVKKTTLPEF